MLIRRSLVRVQVGEPEYEGPHANAALFVLGPVDAYLPDTGLTFAAASSAR